MTQPVNRMRPVHPGEILREDFLEPMDMSVNALAKALNVPAKRIHEIVKERRSVTVPQKSSVPHLQKQRWDKTFLDTYTAERLARYFGGDAASWLNLQAMYDLKTLPTRDEIRENVLPLAA